MEEVAEVRKGDVEGVEQGELVEALWMAVRQVAGWHESSGTVSAESFARGSELT